MDHPATGSAIVSNLARLHTERAQLYKQALHEHKELELDIRSIFERIIEESVRCRQQLYEKPFVEDPGEKYKERENVNTPIPVNTGNRKKILAACLQNELAVLNAYSTALSFVRDKNLKELLQTQRQEIQQLHAHIKSYHDAQ